MYPRMTFEVLIFDLYLLRIGAVPSHFTKQYWGLHPGPCVCQASTVLPEPRPLASPLHTSGKECWLRYIVPFPIAMPSKALHNKHWPPLIVITNALLFILGFTLPYAVGWELLLFIHWTASALLSLSVKLALPRACDSSEVKCVSKLLTLFNWPTLCFLVCNYNQTNSAIVVIYACEF